jgi:hypothetical protein
MTSKIQTLTCALLISLSGASQWSTDASTPMVVCNAANTQRNLIAIADADSGYYVLWSDQRNDADRSKLFGQHFDGEGNALWNANGKLIWDQPGRSVNELSALLMPDGSLVVAFLTGSTIYQGDTTRAMRFNTDGEPLWSQPAVLTNNNTYQRPRLVASGNCAYLMVYCYNCNGGFGGYRAQRFDMNGTIQFDLPGTLVGAGGSGAFEVHPDGAGGILTVVRDGNGAGTPLRAFRYDSLGVAVWAGGVTLSDAAGLQYGFSSSMDDQGALTAVWEVGGSDLRMNRIDTVGEPLWTPAVQVACDQPNSQVNMDELVHDGALYVSWMDSQSDSLGLYVQRFDLATGDPEWISSGVPAILESVYLPTSRLVPSDSGAVIAIMDMSGPSKYAAMRVRADGTLAWMEVASFATSNGPSDGQRVELPDGNGGAVSFWRSPDDNLYGARIYRTGKRYNDVGIGEPASSRSISAFPNPAQDHVRFGLPDDEPFISVELIDMLGRTTTVEGDGRSISIAAFSNGTYTARIITAEGTFTARFIKH